jgi:dipeptide/tripeptide permease
VRSQLSYALSVLPLIVFEETFAVFGNALDVFSLDKLPITVVKTIQSTLPIFVLLFTFIAAHVWKSRANKPLSPRLAFVRFVIMLILIYGVYLVISVEVS